MPRHALSLSLVFMLLLGACTGSGVITVADSSGGYSFGEFVYATSGRDTLVVVRGNPFGMDQGAFEKAVTDAMQGQNWGPRTNFTVRPSETAHPGFRVVMLFHGSETVLGGELCRSPEKFGSAKSDGKLYLTAAFCSGPVALTEVLAWTGPVSDANAPSFARLVARATLDLFPPIDDDILDDDNERRFKT